MAKKQLPAARSTAVTGWADRMKTAVQKQQKAAEQMGSSSNWISFRGGVVQVNGAVAPAGKFNCIILAYMQERSWYENEFDAANPTTPGCYAYGDDEGGVPVQPHAKSTDKQSQTCKTCALSQYGSAAKGRGQACRQSIRIALVPATAEGCAGEPFFARIPPTSIKYVKGWLEDLGDTPCFGAVTELSATPDVNDMFHIGLTVKQQLPRELQGAVLNLLDNAEVQLREPFPELDTPAVTAKPGKKRKL